MQARHALATAVRFDRRRKKLILTLDSGLELAFAPSGKKRLDAGEPLLKFFT